MNRWRLVVILVVAIFVSGIQITNAQCSICTKTAMQQGSKTAEGLNLGIVYLMLAPFAVVGYVGYRWWKNAK